MVDARGKVTAEALFAAKAPLPVARFVTGNVFLLDIVTGNGIMGA